MGFRDRLRHSWEAFTSGFEKNDLVRPPTIEVGMTSSSRPDRVRTRVNAERTFINAVYTRLAIDCAAQRFEHVRTDENGQYTDTIFSKMNYCFSVAANIDQAARNFRQDIYLSMFGNGVVAIVPIETTLDPTTDSGQWDVNQFRVGEVLQWAPEHVQVRVYNQKRGVREDIWLPKSMVALAENPFYSVMNEPNSTLQRLIHKLQMLDSIDEITAAGKLDIIIQLPYSVKSETRKNQAKERMDEITQQLQNSTYGIAYTDGTEKITQLNRSVENTLLEQITLLKQEALNEMGLTQGILDGTADDMAMLNYTNRTIEPLCDAVQEAMIMTFLTKTAITQGQSIMYFQTPFKMIPISKLAEIVDVLSRNQIISPNEVRPALGLKPSKQPQANQLINSNMPLKDQVTGPVPGGNGNTTIEQVPNDPGQQPLALPAGSSSADQQEAALNKQMAELGIG